MKSQLSGQSYYYFYWNVKIGYLLQINDGPKSEGRKSAENKQANSIGAAKRIVASAKKDTVSGMFSFYTFSLLVNEIIAYLSHPRLSSQSPSFILIRIQRNIASNLNFCGEYVVLNHDTGFQRNSSFNFWIVMHWKQEK